MKTTMLILHFIGIAMGIGTGFAHAFLGKEMSKLGKDEANRFRHQLKGLSQMGHVGILLLLVSGVYLIIPYWYSLAALPLLVTKLVLVVVLMILILLIDIGARKAYKDNNDAINYRIGLMGKLSLLTGVTIVILAVNVFH